MSARGRELSSLSLMPIVEVDLAAQSIGLVSASEFSAMANLWRTYRCRGDQLGAGIEHNGRGTGANASSIGCRGCVARLIALKISSMGPNHADPPYLHKQSR